MSAFALVNHHPLLKGLPAVETHSHSSRIASLSSSRLNSFPAMAFVNAAIAVRPAVQTPSALCTGFFGARAARVAVPARTGATITMLENMQPAFLDAMKTYK